MRCKAVGPQCDRSEGHGGMHAVYEDGKVFRWGPGGEPIAEPRANPDDGRIRGLQAEVAVAYEKGVIAGREAREKEIIAFLRGPEGARFGVAESEWMAEWLESEQTKV